jgi:ubiquinone/menaquinone biosynthesis C-methylase UbiE
MKPDFLEVLRDPGSGETLELVGGQEGLGRADEWLVASVSGRRYPIKDGIADFLADVDVTGPNRKCQAMYDKIARLYDLPAVVALKLRPEWFKRAYQEWIGDIEVDENSKVLEVSIGTGLNLLHLPGPARFFGLDISWGMLRQCRRNLRKWGLEADLVHGMAEQLPFADGAFDTVFHSGGINYFNDIGKAIREMIRVAKPGTRILIADENAKHISLYEKIPMVRKYYVGTEGRAKAPADLVPEEMLDVKVKDVHGGRFYSLTFTKPP